MFGHLVGLQLIRFQNLPSFLLCQRWFHTSSAASLGLGFSLSPNIAEGVVNECCFLLFLMCSLLFRNWSRKITNWAAFNPYAPAAVQLLSCIWLFETPLDCSPPGSTAHGVLQARILEWVAISFSINPYTQSSIQTRVGQVTQVRLIRRFIFRTMVLCQERALNYLYLIKSCLGLILEWLDERSRMNKSLELLEALWLSPGENLTETDTNMEKSIEK